MFRVRNQIECTDELVNTCGNAGVTIAMLDTGIANHPDFEDRIVGFKDFVNGKGQSYDDSGHGTHVAGCLCGSGRLSDGKYKGIAPSSYLVVGKVLDYKGDGMIENMVSGIDWILRERKAYNIRILNISIGMGEVADSEKMNKLFCKIDEAWDNGLLVVCAAGNGGPGPMTLSPIGARKKVITVGCHEGGYFGEKDNLCENYSGRGPSEYEMKKPDIVAPGTEIISCNAFFEKRGKMYRNAYVSKSGTSMATPIVAGALALLLQKYPWYTNEQAKRKLQYTAKDLKEPWDKQGFGMVQAKYLLT